MVFKPTNSESLLEELSVLNAIICSNMQDINAYDKSKIKVIKLHFENLIKYLEVCGIKI
jgi:hypothetical protein